MNGAPLHLSQVSKSFDGRQRVLDDVTVDLPAGTLAAVLGPSGCGKTTLLRVIAGFITPDQGRVQIGDLVVTECSGTAKGARQVPPERRGVTVVPQEGALFPHLDVTGNVGYGLRRLSGRVRERRVEELLELVGLGGLGTRRPDELSGGQQQRVALARALAPDPSLVVLDEPFSALDAGLRAQLRTDVREALRTMGTTALLVTHDQTEALSMADSVAVMSDGQLLMHDTPEAVYHRPADLTVARFVGDLVELPGHREGPVMHCALGSFTLDPATDRRAAAAAVGRSTTVGFRPEQLVLEPTSTPGLPTAVVELVDFHGHERLVRLSLEPPGTQSAATTETRLLARTTRDVRVGERVAVRAVGAPLVFDQ